MAGSLCLEYEYIHHNQQVTHDRTAALLARYKDLEITGSRHQRRGLRSVTVKPGTVINDIFCHEDWMPTLMAAVGEPDIKEKLLDGHQAAGKTFKAHLDGYNQADLLSGKGPGKRNEIF
jgi:hypothetical protein